MMKEIKLKYGFFSGKHGKKSFWLSLFAQGRLTNWVLVIPLFFSLNLSLNAQVIENFVSDIANSQQFKRPKIEGEGNQLPDTWVSQDSLYGYTTQKISISVAGKYSFQTDSTSFNGCQDPMLYLYDGNFDPNSPLSHGIAANDDILSGVYGKWKQSSIDSVYLKTGDYTLVVTTWNYGLTGKVYYNCSGPAKIILNAKPSLSAIEDSTLKIETGNKPGKITSSILITSTQNITAAKVQITGNYNKKEDILSFASQNGISAAWDSSTGTLNLSGSASVSNYQAAIRSITYSFTSLNPSGISKSISFTVISGNESSNVLTRSIIVSSNLSDGSKNQATSVNEKARSATSFNLNQNYPNPFNPATTISYSIPNEQNVLLKIYNSLGQQVMTLVNKKQSAGNYSVNFNAAKLASGVYYYAITTESNEGKAGFSLVKKMLLLK